MQCTVVELCRKEVIDIDTAARVGFVTDVEFDTVTGEMVHLCVSPGGGFFRERRPVKICRKEGGGGGEQTVLVKNVPPPPPPRGGRFAGLFGK